MPYITKGDIQNFMLQDINPSYDSFITTIIAFVEDYIDKYCGTTFGSEANATRYFDGSGENELFIGDFSTITSVAILDGQGNVQNTLVENIDFNTFPYNSTPKTTLILASGGQLSRFPCRRRSVKVVGVFGYSSAPSPVKLAGLQLCQKLLDQGLRGGQVTSENLGSYSISYEKVDEEADSLGVKDILNQYRNAGLY